MVISFCQSHMTHSGRRKTQHDAGIVPVVRWLAMQPSPLRADPNEGTRSLQLDALASDLAAEAGRLSGLPGVAEDYDLGRLIRSLFMWSLAVGSTAESGPASLRSVSRLFRDHPEHGLPDPDQLASHRALLDVVSFPTVGDMVLDDLSAMLLTRWHRPSLEAGMKTILRLLAQRRQRSNQRLRCGSLQMAAVKVPASASAWTGFQISTQRGVPGSASIAVRLSYSSYQA